jgi:cell shape-determining protein MreC
MIMSLSHPATEKMRGALIAFLAPMWQTFTQIKQKISFSETRMKEEIERLQLENQVLSNTLAQTSYLLIEKQNLDTQLQELEKISLHTIKEQQNLYQIYLQRLQKQVELRMRTLPAKVIFRSFDNWNHSLWINIGELDNPIHAETIIAKGSAVLVGHSLIGVIDYVGKHQSRVRLITDPGLTPSVRASRGGEQDSLLNEQIDFILNATRMRKQMLKEEDQLQLIKLLQTMKTALQPFKKTYYLAKGELRGSCYPSRHADQSLLKGTGFNYDFADEEGPARDLRTGKLLHDSQKIALPLLKVHDLLVTTGMDGVFPAGLKVAIVTKIGLLKEGDYFYELEAKSTAGNLNDLTWVFVIPPVGYNKYDHPI